MKDYNRAYQLLVQLYDIIKVEGKEWSIIILMKY